MTVLTQNVSGGLSFSGKVTKKTFRGTGILHGGLGFNPISGMNFDGANNYLTFTNTAANITNGSATWSFVSTFYSSIQTQQSQCILCLGLTFSAGSGVSFYVTSGGVVQVTGLNPSSSVTGSLKVAFGVKQTIGVTYDGTTLTLYVNGVADPSTFTGLSPQLAVSSSFVGTESVTSNTGTTGGRHFNGTLNDIRVYASRILSAGEMASYAAGTMPTDTSKVLGYTFSEGTGTTTADTSGNGQTATMTHGTNGLNPVWKAVSTTPTLTETVNKPFSAALSFAGSIKKSIAKKLTGIIAFGTILNGNFEIAPTFVAATTATGVWIDGTAAGSSASGNNSFGWATATSSSGSFAAQFDNTVSNSGSNSLKLSNLSTSSLVSAVTTIGGRNLIPMQPNRQYTLTGFIKTNNVVANGAYIDILVFTIADGTGASITSSTNKLTGTNGFTQVSVTFTTQTAAVCAEIVPRLNVAGNISDAWFDDITLSPATPSPSLTQNVSRQLSGSAGFAGSLNKKLSQLLSGVLLFSGGTNNLIYNGDFEIAPSPNTAPTTGSTKWIDGTAAGSASNITSGWFTSAMGAASAGFDNSTSVTGAYSLHISPSSGSANAQVSVWQGLPKSGYAIPIKPGTKYTMSAWIKTTLNGGSATNGFHIDSSERNAASGNIGGVSLPSSSGITTTTPWTQYTSPVHTAAANAIYLTPKLFLDNTGGAANLNMDVWVDGITINIDSSQSGSFTKTTLKTLSSAVSFAGSLFKAISRPLSGAINFIGSLNKVTVRFMPSANLMFAGSLVKQVGKAFTANLGFIGRLLNRLRPRHTTPINLDQNDTSIHLSQDASDATPIDQNDDTINLDNT